MENNEIYCNLYIKKAPKKAAKKASAKKVRNKPSLKQVALAVTKGKALDAKQILGAAKRIRSVEVTWPSGIKSVEQVTNPALLLELGL